MKTVVAFFLFLSSLALHATACKCNCDPTDFGICASSYDIDHPCLGLCPNQTAGTIPMITACPMTQITNPYTLEKVWISLCTQ